MRHPTLLAFWNAPEALHKLAATCLPREVDDRRMENGYLVSQGPSWGHFCDGRCLTMRRGYHYSILASSFLIDDHCSTIGKIEPVGDAIVRAWGNCTFSTCWPP